MDLYLYVHVNTQTYLPLDLFEAFSMRSFCLNILVGLIGVYISIVDSEYGIGIGFGLAVIGISLENLAAKIITVAIVIIHFI